MTVSAFELGLYAGGVLVLFLTPGPVWVALIARAMAGGFAAAWPLALGVVVGDVLWPVAAIFGVTWLVSVYAPFLTVLRWAGAALFVAMGALLIAHADRGIDRDSRLTRPGHWAGFGAGLLVILGNPKAILFYMGMLPGFFDVARITGWDVAAICAVSFAVPLFGNLALALSVDRVRALLATPAALARLNLAAGALLIGVGIAIALSPV